ncbi:unnamed protein product [Arctia plantaginis]|uniref:Glucose-methanol-choline oxidoreductase N-terminal domain-containing protein n=1 Tax=Arctia plantaginis TaxID=874455 RepID=A0A8S1B6D2_ARCPL|nr:unnamed protein product [Arctia plantaginis]
MSCYNTPCEIPTTGGFPNTFASAVQFFAASQCLLTEGIVKEDYIPSNTKFDFIIVGGGSAGSVLANRLSEIKEWKILLLEAGDDPPVESNVPALDKSVFRTQYDWKYLTTGDAEIDQAVINNSINWPRGKMLGGSSNLNAMIYIEGNDQDYQRWYDAGNLEWSVQDVRRCFKKGQSYQNERLLQNPKITEHYGHNGPLIINTFNSTYRIVADKILKSWNDIGIKNVPDLNTANVLGSGIVSVTAAYGERQSSNKAYLNPVLHRKNLKVLKNSFVTKILIRRSSKVAYGVESTDIQTLTLPLVPSGPLANRYDDYDVPVG